MSETFAMEVLARCDGAELIKTETEIGYDPPSSKKTDLLVSFDDVRIGVSVTERSYSPSTGLTTRQMPKSWNANWTRFSKAR